MNFHFPFLAILSVAISLNAQAIPTKNVTHKNFNANMGFSIQPGILQKSKDGVISYTLTIKKPWNDFFGVTVAIMRGKEILARFPILGVELPTKDKSINHVFECDLSPEIAKKSIIVFQLFPNTDKVTFFKVDLASWPVMIVKDAKYYYFVPLDQVEENLIPPKTEQDAAANP